MSRGDDVVGGAGLYLVGGARLLHPREQVFEAMLEGWRNQRAFVRHLEVYPWEWTPAMVDEWFADLRGIRHLAKSPLRGCQGAVRGFCSYPTHASRPPSLARG